MNICDNLWPIKILQHFADKRTSQSDFGLSFEEIAIWNYFWKNENRMQNLLA